jgi:molybdate transport system regulatory protein
MCNMRYGNKTLGPRLRVTLRKGIAFGPGKADLLEGIRDTGSIAAAARLMKMSYTRAWGLVTEMNAEYRSPLVESAKGGAGRGGASLTPLGKEVLKRFRRMENAAARATAGDLSALRKKLS